MRKLHVATGMLLVLLSSVALAGRKSAPPPSERTGPVGKGTPPTRWGSRCWDPVNSEWLWFGGTGGVSREGGLKTWVYKNGAWSRREFEFSPELLKAEKLRLASRALYAAVANRYYVSETPKARGVKLGEKFKALRHALQELPLTNGSARKYKDDARAIVDDLLPRLSGKLSVAEIASARKLMMALVRLCWVLSPEPPLRNFANMRFDKKTGKMVLFGGEGVYGAFNDTWIYDCKTRRWTLTHPALAPSPRFAHGMVAHDGHVYVAGGFAPRGSMSYCAPLWKPIAVDLWRFDINTSTWTLLDKGKAINKRLKMGDTVHAGVKLTLSEDGRSLSWEGVRMKKDRLGRGTFVLPGSDAGTEEDGKSPDSILSRELGFDPAWYEKVPPVDEEAFQTKLKSIPPNKWVHIATPVRHVSRDWGTTILDVDRDQLLHWAGGHSSHCGTDVAHFSLATGRWHIFYTPEIPFAYTYNSKGAGVPTLTGKRPWGPHSYLSYAYDRASQKMIWAGTHIAYHGYGGNNARVNPGGLWTYDPENYEWSTPPWKIEGGWFHMERHKTCMVPTEHGVAVWADKKGGYGAGPTGLWLTDSSQRVFKPVTATARKDKSSLPLSAYGDAHGMTYDSKRDRVLLMSVGRSQFKGKIWAVDLKTRKIDVLTPEGIGDFPKKMKFIRECTYIPDADMVLAQGSLLYDCAKNRWVRMVNPFTKVNRHINSSSGVSTGIEWDPKRKLLWLVQSNGAVFAMRFEPGTAGLKALGVSSS